MRTLPVRVLILLALPSFAASQTAKPRPEIGIRAGLSQMTTKSDFGSETMTVVGLPTGVLFAPGGLHATFFVAPRWALEPQLGFVRLSQDGESFSLTALAAQVNGFLGNDANRSPYLFGQIGMLREDEGGESDSQTGFGGGVGYRRVHRESIAMRYEVRYRRWTGGGSGLTTNEVSLLVGVGAVIR